MSNPYANYSDSGTRSDYLQSLADEYEVPRDIVNAAADILGSNEDFDGLPSMLQDYYG